MTPKDWVIGTDEVGYGAWAGPLVVAGVLVPGSWEPPTGLTDSKKVRAVVRKRLFKTLIDDPTVRHLVHVTPPEKIDQLGVYTALIQAHQSLHESLRSEAPEAFSIADGSLVLGAGILSEPKADGHVPAVSAASIIAKVTRDQMMHEADGIYPGYGFSSNKGYGGDDDHPHVRALRRLGPCPIHRRSYAPIAKMIAEMSASEPLTAWEIPTLEL